ncbi:PH domain-containing protein [Oceanobacillus chungangensis]|nr:PH domain-containing protein [Oceanobacillus chungangensis]
MMSKEQRLHPAAILFNLMKGLKEMVFLIILGFFTFRDSGLLYYILAIVAIIVLGLVSSFLSWYRYTYRIENEELCIEYGVFIRKKRFISKNRIQSIDLTQGVLHRIFKLTKVQIETAGSGDGAEASLQAVKFAEGERLQNELKNGITVVIEQNDDEPEHPTSTISFKRLFLAGSTSGSLGIILAILGGGLSEIEQFIPEQFFETTVQWIIGLSIFFIAGLAFLVLIIVWLVGIAGTMIKYGNFTITKHHEELFITRGLLEKKQITIPLKRIQAIGIEESILRQPLGYVTVFAEVAGGTSGKGEDAATVLFPIMKQEEVASFLAEFLPDYAIKEEEWTGLPKRALKYYLLRSSIFFLLASIAVFYFFPKFSLLPVLLLLVFIYLGHLRYKDAGYQVKGEQLLLRYRLFSKKTMIMYHNRIQSFEKKQHIVHRKQKLGNMHVSIIGKMGGAHFYLKEFDVESIDHLSDWYSYRDI